MLGVPPERSGIRVWIHGENGRGLVGEEKSRIQCERCEV